MLYFKKNIVYKVPRGGGGAKPLAAHGLIYQSVIAIFIFSCQVAVTKVMSHGLDLVQFNFSSLSALTLTMLTCPELITV